MRSDAIKPSLSAALQEEQSEAGDYRNSEADNRRIAIATAAQALSWYRERTLETWKPIWLFVTQPRRLIGIGWRGVLVIWRGM